MSDAYAIGEHDRMIAAMLQAGTIEIVDHSAARARVRIGNWVSAYLPWHVPAAGAVRIWRAPSVGEQCLLISPSGMPEAGFILPGFYTTTHGQADNRDHVTVIRMPDGAQMLYDWQAGALLVEGTQSVTVKNATTVLIDSGGPVTVKAPSVTLDAPETTVTGNLTIGGALAQGVSGSSGGGNATFGGQVHAQGDVTAGGISLQGHTHTEQGDGAPTSVAR